MSISDELIQHLRRNACVAIGDLLSLYNTPFDERFERGWTALCESVDGGVAAKYSPHPTSNLTNYFSRDFSHAMIVKSTERPKINFSGSKINFSVNSTDDPNDILISASRWVRSEGNQPCVYFQRDTKYEIYESLSPFDLNIAEDISSYRAEYERNYAFLLGDFTAPDKLSDDLLGQLALCANQNIPLLTIQGPPGTGKTTFLAELVVKLVKERIAAPGDIACLAYTNKAADEIAKKLQEMVSDGQISPESVGTSPQIKNCFNKVYVGTIFKNPIAARDHRRKWIFIDEASQIPLPTLLYSFRYAKDGGQIVRLFGDHEQLGPVSAYVRNPAALPKSFISDEWLDNCSPETKSKLAYAVGARSMSEIFSKEKLNQIQSEHVRSKYGQSIFSIGRFVKELNGSRDLEDAFKKINLVRPENHRQEMIIHEITHDVFYPHVKNHISLFDVALSNIRELHRLGEKSGAVSNLVSFDAQDAQNTLQRVYGVLGKVVSFLKRTFQSLLHRNVKITESERKNFKKDPPLMLLSPEEFKSKLRDFINNPASATIFQGTGLPNADALGDLLLECLSSPVVVVRHNFPQSKNNTNDFEAFLSCFILSVYEMQPFRNEGGFGVVTPYRNQEIRIKMLFRQLSSASAMGKIKDWCATPERFQGRDLSRCVYSAVTSDDKPYLEPGTMFSGNKLNVATSRAASQQVILAHESFWGSLDGLKNSYAKLQPAEQKIASAYPLRYRESMLAYVEHKNVKVCELKF